MATDPSLAPEAALEAPCDDVLRAVVVALLAAYYQARPGDTRFEKAALAALPAEHRAEASAQLSRIVALTKKLARQAETRRRQERDERAPIDSPARCRARPLPRRPLPQGAGRMGA